MRENNTKIRNCSYKLRRLYDAFWKRRTIARVATEESAIALTFDDGPHPASTPSVLSVLNKHNVNATFFMIGRAVSMYREIANQVSTEGHTIGNHSWDHSSFIEITHSERKRQIRKCDSTLPVTSNAIFRPPYGAQNFWSWVSTLTSGHEVIGWSIDAKDWTNKSANYISRKIISNSKKGCIILLHDSLYKSMDNTNAKRLKLVKALKRILSSLKSKYKFVTIPELLSLGKVKRI